MNLALLESLLFAQISKWERLGDGIHRGRGRMDPMDLLPIAIVLVVVVVAIVIVAKLRKRNDMTEHCDDPQKLFRELSLAHELDRADLRLLTRLASELELNQPAEVFLRPAAFDGNIPADLADEADELRSLGQRLFR